MENVLTLRKRLSIFEAAGLLRGNRQQIVELMREAIEAGELSAVEVVRHGIYSADNGGWLPGGPINYMQTIIERAEFERWFDATGLQTSLTAPAQTPTTPAPVVETDYSLLATPAELLDAFEKWGLVAAWFDDLNSHKWLLDARRKKGQGQRGHVIEPLFCPFDVMNGLIGKVRKTSRLNPDTAWRTLEHKFPEVYAAFQEHDPREVTGD